VPFTDAAKSELGNYKSGASNFVELWLDDAQQNVLASGKSVGSVEEAAKVIVTNQPRFYLYKHAGGKNVFIFSCPDRAPPKLKMGYSSAKAGVAEQLSKEGVTLEEKKIEIREGLELTADLLKDQLGASSGTASPAVAAKASSTPPTAVKTAVAARAASGTIGVIGVKGSPPVAGGGTVNASSTKKLNAPHPIYNLMSSQVGASGSDNARKKKIVMPPPGAYC